MGKNPHFSRWLKERSSKRECKGLSIQGYLIMPVQRIPRYKLLLEDLLKHTAEDHADYHNLRKSLHLIEQIATFVNEMIRQHEMAMQMLDIQKSLLGFNENLIVPGRRLVHKGSVQKICRKTHQTRVLLLFSDILVYASPGLLEDQYLFHRKLDLEFCRVESVPDTEALKNIFQIVSPEKSFAMYTRTAREKAEWIRVIEQTVSDLQNGRRTLRTGLHGDRIARACDPCFERISKEGKLQVIQPPPRDPDSESISTTPSWYEASFQPYTEDLFSRLPRTDPHSARSSFSVASTSSFASSASAQSAPPMWTPTPGQEDDPSFQRPPFAYASHSAGGDSRMSVMGVGTSLYNAARSSRPVSMTMAVAMGSGASLWHRLARPSMESLTSTRSAPPWSGSGSQVPPSRNSSTYSTSTKSPSPARDDQQKASSGPESQLQTAFTKLSLTDSPTSETASHAPWMVGGPGHSETNEGILVQQYERMRQSPTRQSPDRQESSVSPVRKISPSRSGSHDVRSYGDRDGSRGVLNDGKALRSSTAPLLNRPVAVPGSDRPLASSPTDLTAKACSLSTSGANTRLRDMFASATGLEPSQVIVDTNGGGWSFKDDTFKRDAEDDNEIHQPKMDEPTGAGASPSKKQRSPTKRLTNQGKVDGSGGFPVA
ncbi:hypothetical protein HK102_002203 [Quaeritorhiza haematococci]|nr:hypothetical protein HK102_002203 [Quaeritorhiza haematococci]